jgi:D-serine dehydratase
MVSPCFSFHQETFILERLGLSDVLNGPDDDDAVDTRENGRASGMIGMPMEGLMDEALVDEDEAQS